MTMTPRTLLTHLGPRGLALLAALLLLALAAAHPSPRLPRATFDYVAVFDITQSMNATDADPAGRPVSRLAHAKAAMAHVLRRLPCGSRIGWGVFTEYRILLLATPVEVCANYPDLAASLARIDAPMSWAGASEVAKGLYSGLRTTAVLPDRPALLFLTDGHEAPPVHPDHRPRFGGKPGELPGIIVGVGGDALVRIPKRDHEGKAVGFWRADEVAQTDPYSRGRPGSSTAESLVDEQGRPEARRAPSGTEHLSSLKEAYLMQLAGETGLDYARLTAPDGLLQAVTQPRFARHEPVPTDLHAIPAALALACLALPYLAGLRRRT